MNQHMEADEKHGLDAVAREMCEEYSTYLGHSHDITRRFAKSLVFWGSRLVVRDGEGTKGFYRSQFADRMFREFMENLQQMNPRHEREVLEQAQHSWKKPERTLAYLLLQKRLERLKATQEIK